MNTDKLSVYEKEILLRLASKPMVVQRELAEECECSLGMVNRSIGSLIKNGYINSEYKLNENALSFILRRSPKRAVILAAGFGMRMVPINLEAPKALLEVKGEILIERQIRQLHEVGIREIYVIVGFMKEKFEYLMDEFGVELIVNPEYGKKNNLFSLKKASSKLNNCYIIPCDIYCNENPYREKELYSWYMVTDKNDAESEVRVSRTRELVKAKHHTGNRMIGISYITDDAMETLASNMCRLMSERDSDEFFWEKALYDKKRMIVNARIVNENEVYEINTYEQLREIDSASLHLHSEAMKVIAETLNVSTAEIVDISILKKGMTNRSFLFSCKGKKYIMRIPGEGTDILIDRKHEYDVYQAIAGNGICDEPVYINPENGYKITSFLNNVRVCNSNSIGDLKKCMSKLRAFHEKKLKVGHEFDIFYQISFYEELWGGVPSVYPDYTKTKENVWKLRAYIEQHAKEKTLTHIDAVADNFLFYSNNGKEELQLTDWEYAGLQDSDVDIAMFCIYALYDKEQVDRLISIYYYEGCDRDTRIKIYCYIAACGLLWSNWCEYKSMLGVEFGEYSLRQYRYAKEYYAHAISEMNL